MSGPRAVDEVDRSLVTPASCPFCRSPKVMTTSGKVDVSTYWRCEACGEMWNVDRLHVTESLSLRMALNAGCRAVEGV